MAQNVIAGHLVAHMQSTLQQNQEFTGGEVHVTSLLHNRILRLGIEDLVSPELGPSSPPPPGLLLPTPRLAQMLQGHPLMSGLYGLQGSAAAHCH